MKCGSLEKMFNIVIVGSSSKQNKTDSKYPNIVGKVTAISQKLWEQRPFEDNFYHSNFNSDLKGTQPSIGI